MTIDFSLEGSVNQLSELALAARTLAQPVDLQSTLVVVMEQLQTAFACDAVGALLVENGHAAPAAASDALAERADKLQIHYAEGPGLDAIGRGGEMVVEDLQTEHRWPAWRPQAVELGWSSLVSIGLTGAQRPFGAVTLYSRRLGYFSRDDLPLGQVFVAQAAIALAGARERESLLKAVDARHEIGQAQGILMERYNVDAEQAFTVLRRYSSHTNRKLRLVAEEIVRSRRLPNA